MNVVLSTTGMSHLSNSMPMSRSIQGNAFSWPMARMTSSHGRMIASDDLLLAACRCRLDRPERSNSIPSSLPFSMTKRIGAWFSTISTLLFLGVLELPRRRLEVLARPARHDLDVVAAEPLRRAAAVHRGVADADDQHALADRRRCGRSEPTRATRCRCGSDRRRGGRGCRAPCPSARRCRRTRRRSSLRRAAPSGCRPASCSGRRRPCRGCSRSPRRARCSGRRNAGMLMRIRPPGLRQLLEDRDLVAERHQIVGDRERRRARADERDALAVLARRRLRQQVA